MYSPVPLRNIEINNTKKRHFALAYLLGTTRLSFIQLTELEPVYELMDGRSGGCKKQFQD